MKTTLPRSLTMQGRRDLGEQLKKVVKLRELYFNMGEDYQLYISIEFFNDTEEAKKIEGMQSQYILCIDIKKGQREMIHFK